jgi:5-methylcytosine-specific restriction endonuclease McrA
LRARDRERYATDPRVRQQRIDDAMARYWALKDDPEALAQRRQRTAAAQARHRDKTMYGGNRVPALERDGYTCQSCGASPDYLEVHHIDGRGSMLPVAEQNNDLTNLVTLCGPCHAKVHRRQENFLRNRGTRGEREEQQQD